VASKKDKKGKQGETKEEEVKENVQRTNDDVRGGGRDTTWLVHGWTRFGRGKK
jgi:hypothetical protein